MTTKPITPKTDGVDHINVYSQGQTELGKLLSNFALMPFKHTTYGKFNSVEGLWYWLKCKRQFGIEYLELKMAYGAEAKSRGKELLSVADTELPNFPDEAFMEDIKEAIRCKLRQNTSLLNLLISSSLPLTHYYVMNKGSSSEIVRNLPQHQWQLDEIERIRSVSQNFLSRKGQKNFPTNPTDANQ